MAESQCKGKAKKFNLEWILKYGLEVSTRDPCTVRCECSVISSAMKMKMLNESGKGIWMQSTSATHGELTILVVTWSSNIQWNGMITQAWQWKRSKNSLWRINLLKLSTWDPLSSQKGVWRLKSSQSKMPVHNWCWDHRGSNLWIALCEEGLQSTYEWKIPVLEYRKFAPSMTIGKPQETVLPLNFCALLSQDFVSCMQEQRIQLLWYISELCKSIQSIYILFWVL